MKRTRKLLCLVTLLLCFAVNGWADSVTLTQGTDGLKKTTGTGGKTTIASFDNGKISIEIDVITDNINNTNNFKFDDGGTIVITPAEGVTVTNVKATTASLKGTFKVGDTDVNLTTTGYTTSFTSSTTITYSGSSKTTITQFTIEYTGGSTGETTKKAVTLTCTNASDAANLVVGGAGFTPTITAKDGETDVPGTITVEEKGTASGNISISGNAVTGTQAGSATVTVTFTPTDNTKYDVATIDIPVTVTETGTSDTDVPAPSIKTLTYSTTRGIFTEENSLSNGDGIPYYGCIAVNAAYADEYGNFQDMSNKVSGLIYKFDTKTYTKEEFANHEVAGITTVSTRSALITIDGRTSEHLYLSVIAYHIKDGKRYYSDVVTRKYKYTDPGTRKELTLSCSESPFTLPLTTRSSDPTADDPYPVYTDTKTVTVTATSAGTTVTGLSFISRSSNRKLALSHMTKEGTTETTDADNKILLMDNGRRSGVVTVLVATPGNDEYLPAFMKVNVSIIEGNITTMPHTEKDSKYYIYKSIAELRAAARKYRLDNPNGNPPKGNFILQLEKNNPATVVARLPKDDTKTYNQNDIFITDNSGYGLWIQYEAGTEKANLINGQYNTETAKRALTVGSTVIGTIVGTYRESESNIPEINVIKASAKADNVTYPTSITVGHSGESSDFVGATVPVTIVADVYTVHKTVEATSSQMTNKDEADSSYRPYVNTVVNIPGVIRKGTDNNETVYYLVDINYDVLTENEKQGLNEEKYRLPISATMLDDINLENYVGLEGVFTGLLVKRDRSKAKLLITRQNFFEAEELDEFILDETLPEGRVADRYNTGALSNKVNVKIHRKGWTTDTWGTICLPFDMTAAEFEATFGQGINALAECTGTVENSALKFTVLTEKDIKAGVPYLIKVNGSITNGTGKTETDDNYYATISDRLITVPAPNVVTVAYDKNPIIGTKFEFRGLFGKKTEASETNADGTHDALAGNQKYQYISTKEGQYLHYLPAGSANGFAGLRAYLYFPEWDTELNNTTSGSSSSKTTALTFCFVSDGATGISGIVEEGVCDGKVFNLSGQYVGNSPSGLTKGIYIRNGKKFVVK